VFESAVGVVARRAFLLGEDWDGNGKLRRNVFDVDVGWAWGAALAACVTKWVANVVTGVGLHLNPAIWEAIAGTGWALRDIVLNLNPHP
jgi:hypothetical protein